MYQDKIKECLEKWCTIIKRKNGEGESVFYVQGIHTTGADQMGDGLGVWDVSKSRRLCVLHESLMTT